MAYQLHPYGESWVIYHPKTGQLLAINDTGRFIWEYYQQGHLAQDIAAALQHHYQVSLTQAQQDVDLFIQSWQAVMAFGQQTLLNQENTFSFEPIRPTLSVKNMLQVSCYHLAGQAIAIGFDNMATAEQFRTILGHLEITRHQPKLLHFVIEKKETDYGVHFNQQSLLTTLDGAIEQVLFLLVETAYRAQPTQVVFHASAVIANKQAILFIGGQGSGKSTLVATLAALGMPYLADDVCPIAATRHELIPIPAPQAIKPGSIQTLTSNYPQLIQAPRYQRFGHQICYLAPQTDEQAIWQRNWPVRALFFPQYQPDSKPNIQSLTPEERLALIADSGSLQGAEDISHLLDFVAKTPGFAIHYSNSADATQLVHIGLNQANHS